MKILYITYGLSSGGAERFLTDLLNQLVVKDDLDIIAIDKITRTAWLFVLCPGTR